LSFYNQKFKNAEVASKFQLIAKPNQFIFKGVSDKNFRGIICELLKVIKRTKAAKLSKIQDVETQKKTELREEDEL